MSQVSIHFRILFIAHFMIHILRYVYLGLAILVSNAMMWPGPWGTRLTEYFDYDFLAPELAPMCKTNGSSCNLIDSPELHSSVIAGVRLGSSVRRNGIPQGIAHKL